MRVRSSLLLRVHGEDADLARLPDRRATSRGMSASGRGASIFENEQIVYGAAQLVAISAASAAAISRQARSVMSVTCSSG